MDHASINAFSINWVYKREETWECSTREALLFAVLKIFLAKNVVYNSQ